MITKEDTGGHGETQGRRRTTTKSVRRAEAESRVLARKMRLPGNRLDERRRPAAPAGRRPHFDAVMRKRIYFTDLLHGFTSQIYFTTSSVFSAPFFTPWPTALVPFFTPCPVSLATVSAVSPVLSAAFSVACPVFTAAFLVACPVSLAASFTSVPTWPYENAVKANRAAAIVNQNFVKQNFVFIVPPEELKSSSVAEFYQRMGTGATAASIQGQELGS